MYPSCMVLPVKQTFFRCFYNLLITVWKHGSYKCNVTWTPIKDTCSWLLEAWEGNWLPRGKAQAATDAEVTEGTKCVDVAFSICLVQCSYWQSGYVGGGGSCCSWRQVPARGTGSLRVQLRLENPVFRETKSCISGWQQLTDCSCPAKCQTQQELRSLNTQKIFLITPELSRRFDLRLPISHNSRMLLTHGKMLSWGLERQAERFGASLLFDGSCEAITAPCNGANACAFTPVVSLFSK